MLEPPFSKLVKFFHIAFFLAICFIIELSICGLAFARGDFSVRGHVRKDGTYVQPHMRSAPDGNFNNNWSTYGNTNPYTGKDGTKGNPAISNPSYGGEIIPKIPTSPNRALNPDNAGASQMPQNAKINVYGNGWDCQHGFRQSGNECIAVQMPQNAKINVYGNGWDCQHGFRQSGNECAAF